MSLREKFQSELKQAMHSKNTIATATIRLISAALKDRDIAARSKGNMEGIAEDEILSMLQTMIKQRKESITMYEKGGRPELAEKEASEITVIEGFLPRQITGQELDDAIISVIDDEAATSIKDMGKVMATLRERYAGQMDFGAASAIVKQRLIGQ